MASLNKVMLIGNLGKDPETKYLPSGDAVTNASIATSMKWKDKSSGEDREETEWHRLVFFGRQAEIAGEYLKKGAPIHVEGRLKTRKWDDKNGTTHYSTEIVVDRFLMLGSRPQEQEQEHTGPTREQPRDQQRGGERPAAKPAAKKPAGKFDDMEDDIPF